MLGFMIRTIAILACASLNVACSSVQQPIAQVPLVDASTQHEVVAASSVSTLLERSPSQQVIGDAGDNIIASPTFYSARGNYCRFLTSPKARTLFCKAESGEWFEVPAVLSNLQSVERGGSE